MKPEVTSPTPSPWSATSIASVPRMPARLNKKMFVPGIFYDGGPPPCHNFKPGADGDDLRHGSDLGWVLRLH